MNPEAILDIIAVLAALVAIVRLVIKSGQYFQSGTRLLLAGLLFFVLLYNLCLALEWLGITTQLDRVEDYIGALVPMWWAFIFYAFIHETNLRNIQTLNSQLEQRVLSLQEAEARFRTIFDSASDGILIAQPGNKSFFAANAKLCKMMGYTKEEILNLGVSDIHPEDSLPYVIEQFKKLEREEMTVAKNVPVLRKDKSVFFADISASLMNIDHEDFLVGMFRDISERKHTEESLSKSERKFSSTFHLNPNAMAISDIVTSKFIDVNEAFTSQTGYSREEIIGKSAEDLQMWVNPDDRKQITNALQEKGEIKGTEVLMRAKNDNIQNVLFSARFVEIEQDNYLLTFALDITERKRMENELRLREQNFRQSLDNSPLGVRISTLAGETIYANRTILDIYGYESIEELKKTPIQDRYTPESYSAWQVRKQKRLCGEFGPSEYEITIRRKDGGIRHLYAFRKELLWNGQQQSQIIYQDITDRKLAEEKLQHTLDSLKKAVGTTIQVLVSALESRDPYTAGHQLRVADLACAIAREMGLAQDKIEGIRMSGVIHDIGKLSIPAEILTKPSKLTNLEFSLIKEHPKSGYEMLRHVESPWPLAQIVHQHHERLDGTGYPNKLSNGDILVEARIMAVADVVEAMASHRPYRASLGIQAALEEIEKNKGVLYDGHAADACLRLFREKNYRLLEKESI